MTSTPAQKRAAANYRARKSGDSARLPGVLLSPDEAALLDEMAAIYGSKKGAIIAGLKKLKKDIDI